MNTEVKLSFDQYGRYYLIAKLIEANRPSKKPLKILDVGGAGTSLPDFLPNDTVYIIDVLDNITDVEHYYQGSALDMPFADEEFDMVVSSDTLEHIPENKRDEFLTECHRVTKNLMIVGAPFDTEGVAIAEKRANELYEALNDIPYIWLKEHKQYGLPKIENVHSWAKRNKLHTLVLANNELNEWQSLISNYFVKESLPSHAGDLAYRLRSDRFNKTRNRAPSPEPSYRHVFTFSKNSIKEPKFQPAKSNEDFASLVPIYTAVRSHIREKYQLVPDREYTESAIDLGVYATPEKDYYKILNDRLLTAETKVAVMESSADWKLMLKMQKSRVFYLFVKTLYKILSLAKKAIKYRVYLSPPNLSWRINTGMPAYYRNKLNSLRFSHPKKPDVSIIIPIYNKLDLTLDCLESIKKLRTKLSYEVIVVDDHSRDASKRLLSQIPGLVFFRNESNQGFVVSCNKGAELANGEFIVFLNNDTLVDKHWLDPLINRIKNDPNVGMSGSKLVYPTGSLQEAGGIIFRDGSGWNYGRGDDPGLYKYNYAREVDYCSGASIAIRKELFDAIGGFDRRYIPAYYEDTDLAFEVRKRGLKVMYEPQSVVTHLEGASSGQDLTQGMKKHQLLNQPKFVKKWQMELVYQELPSEKNVLVARDRSAEKAVLIMDHYVPEPDKDSGSYRMSMLISIFQELGYKITFWSQNLYKTEPYTSQLQARGVEVIYGSVDFFSFAHQRSSYFNMVLLARPSVAPVYIDLVNTLFTEAAVIYDTVDLSYLRLSRQAKLEKNRALAKVAAKWRNVELGLVQRADMTLVVSDIEKNMLKKYNPNANVEILSNIHVQKDGESFDKRKDLLFIGGFSHEPNRDAVLWFAHEILPAIRKELPEVKIHIVGSNVPQDIHDISSKHVIVHGYVQDVEPIFRSARVFVAPLRYGAGVKGKIGQAMEYNLPVVSTAIGVEGMHMTDKKDCLIADTAEDFAAAVIKLYKDEKLWTHVGFNAQKILDKYLSKSAAKEALINVINTLSVDEEDEDFEEETAEA